jgi:flagellar basal body L-ring protein FlgH
VRIAATVFGVMAWLALPAAAASAQGPSAGVSNGASAGTHKDSKRPGKASDHYDELYAQYLQQARVLPQTTTAPDSQWMTGLFGDLRARRVNDLVTVRVIESVAATGAADSNLDKNSSANASVSKLFGLEGRLPAALDPTNLVTAGANTSFKGGGATSRSGDLTAVITARVSEVLPNGDLALEGVQIGRAHV